MTVSKGGGVKKKPALEMFCFFHFSFVKGPRKRKRAIKSRRRDFRENGGFLPLSPSRRKKGGGKKGSRVSSCFLMDLGKKRGGKKKWHTDVLPYTLLS